MAGKSSATTTKSSATTTKKTVAAVTPSPAATEEAKSRFNAALDEAKAGAAVLTEDAKARAAGYRDQAKAKGEDWTADAKTKASELAVEGKAKASGALSGLSRIVDENAAAIDEKLGPKYGDYARTASRSIQDTADKLEQKSIDDLGNDAREFVRNQPAAALGIAAAAGFLISRLFRK